MLNLPRTIAHRGASKVAPENTLAALYKAKDLGALWVEFDVMLTRDGVPIVIHDAKLNRTTNGNGRVHHFNLDELKKLDAGSWFDKDFSKERIPTLAEWLKVAATLKLGVNIELKESSSRAKPLAIAVHSHLQQHWSRDLPKPLISSATIQCLNEVYKLDRHYALGWISDLWPFRVVPRLKKHHCFSMHVNYKCLNERRVMELKHAGYRVLAYTVNKKELAESLWKMGVDSVFTDQVPLNF